MSKIENILSWTFLVLYLGSFFFMLYHVSIRIDNLTVQVKETRDYVLSNLLYDPGNEAKTKVAGAYFFDKDYYCVLTKDRDWEDIRYTDYHEMCHAFVDMDGGHFINLTNQTRLDIGNHINIIDRGID